MIGTQVAGPTCTKDRPYRRRVHSMHRTLTAKSIALECASRTPPLPADNVVRLRGCSSTVNFGRLYAFLRIVVIVRSCATCHRQTAIARAGTNDHDQLMLDLGSSDMDGIDCQS